MGEEKERERERKGRMLVEYAQQFPHSMDHDATPYTQKHLNNDDKLLTYEVIVSCPFLVVMWSYQHPLDTTWL